MKKRIKYSIAIIIASVVVAIVAQFELNFLCYLANGHYDSTKMICLEQNTHEELYFVTNGVFYLIYVLVFFASAIATIQCIHLWLTRKV